ncbi:MAG: SDR family NAD(P)-dependent oxidoreductase [Bradyrhizobium sp.]
MDFIGKVALVTGGSGDIGRTIAEALAGAGADVAVSYVGEAARAGELVEALRTAGRRSCAVQLDQRDFKSIDDCVRNVIGHFGRIDILINNAGWNIGIPFGDLAALHRKFGIGSSKQTFADRFCSHGVLPLNFGDTNPVEL